MFKQLGVVCVAACLPAALLADFSYEQSTKITGGAMMSMMRFAGAFSKQAREPIQGTVSVKGNKMVHTSKDRADIIDLDSETMTAIDFATGVTRWSQLAGTGFYYNNNYAPVSIGPQRKIAYVGVLGGLMSLQDVP